MIKQTADRLATKRDLFATWGEQGLVIMRISVAKVSGLEAEHVIETIRANGMTWPDTVTGQLETWRHSGLTRTWPAVMLFDVEGRLVYAGAGPEAQSRIESAMPAVVVPEPDAPLASRAPAAAVDLVFSGWPGR